MKKALDKAVKEIEQYREEIENKLLEFARSDLLLFWGEKRDKKACLKDEISTLYCRVKRAKTSKNHKFLPAFNPIIR